MSDAEQYFHQAVIYAVLSTAFDKVRDAAKAQFCREWAIYLTAKGLEALALSASPTPSER